MERQTSRAIEIMCTFLGALSILLAIKEGFFTASALPTVVMFIIYILCASIFGVLYFLVIGFISYFLSDTNYFLFNLIKLAIIISIAIFCIIRGYVS